ncbi:MAG TPA: hypothetical protein VG722_09925 [Tepidisphaeraceae bacterium]|nr:hypothetical protein [Tepidisphaeraceae bacterium]
MRLVRRSAKILMLVLASAMLSAGQSRPTTESATRPNAIRPLNAREVSDIRLSLLKPGDVDVALRFEHDVLRRYSTATSRPWKSFEEEPHIEQAIEIINDPNQAFRHDVRVLSDPPEMVEFKFRILPLVLAGCASSGCHSADGTDEFRLSHKTHNEGYVYADFDQLRKYVKTVESDRQSMFATARVDRLINLDDPESSLLVQYALPARLAQTPHPATRHWRPMATSKSDPRYRELLRWIEALSQINQ